MKLPLRMSLLLVFAILALAAAACGTSDEQSAPVAPVTADEPSALPPNPNPGDTPAVAGACVEGEPNCNDTLATGDEPQDLPPPGDDVAPTGMLVDGGLTVSDALVAGGSGPIAVMGFLFIDGDGARLCEVLAESYPPQCGGALAPIEGYEEVLGVPLSSAQGISWTDQHVSFLGEFVNGTFVVDATVSG